MPAPPQDLSAQRRGDALVLSWTPPQRTSDGVALKGSTTAQACWWNGTRPTGTACPAKTPLRGEPAEVSAAALAAAGLGTDGVNVCIEVLNARGQAAGCSNVAHSALTPVAAAPAGVTATAVPLGIELRWQAIAAPVRIYREPVNPSRAAGPGAKPASPAPLLATASSGADHYLDSSTVPGQRYRYFLRASAGSGSGLVESADSAAVEALAGDYTPPAPSGLRAIGGTNGGVDLSWDPVDAPGLAGYNVYRALAGGGWSKLNRDPVATPVFHDVLPAGVNGAQYRVTAVGPTGNESAPSAVSPE